MSLPSFFTKHRSRERSLFVTIGLLFAAMAVVQTFRSQFGVAAFLGAMGTSLMLAGWLLAEKYLSLLAVAVIAVNIAVAVVALL